MTIGSRRRSPRQAGAYVFEFHPRPLARCLLGPLIDLPATLPPLLLGVGLAVLVGWAAGDGWGWLLFLCLAGIYEIRVYRSDLRADGSGVLIMNPFRRHHIAWADINWILATMPFHMPSKIEIGVKHPPRFQGLMMLDGIRSMSSLTASIAERDTAARALIALGAEHGYEIGGGSWRDAARQRVEGYERERRLSGRSAGLYGGTDATDIPDDRQA